MLNRTKLRLLTMFASLLTVVALTQTGANSLWLLYEPQMPQKLKR